MTPDQPELTHCTACGAMAGEPCFSLNATVTVNGVTRRAVHAARYADCLPPEERAAFWMQQVGRYYDDELEELSPKKLAASTSTEGETR